MRRLVFILCFLCLGAFVFSENEVAIDDYYANIDGGSVLLSAHSKLEKSGDSVLRKRVHKRKRIRRPPMRGK